ncbi:MAG: hypothetical protein R6V10_10830 [bacterium]
MKKRLKPRVFACLVFFLLIQAAGGLPEDTGVTYRKTQYLSSLPPDLEGSFGAVARLSTNRPLRITHIEHNLDRVNNRHDCADFRMAGFLRLMYLHNDNPALKPEVKKAVISAILDFKYWIDEPGRDSMCYWSENHQVLFHSAEYLAGSLFPDRVFSNTGMTGREHREKGRRLLMRWFSWRERFGFSEWLSNSYYDEDFYALLNLNDFAPEPDIRKRARMILHQLALNMALNSYKGQMSSTHGRTYESTILHASGDDLKQVMYILFGNRKYTGDLAELDSAAVALATSDYEAPDAIHCIAGDDRTMENYQTHGLHISEAPDHGISYHDPDSLMYFWGMGMYSHPKVMDLTAKMWEEWNLWDNTFFMGLPSSVVWLSERAELEPVMNKLNIASEGAFLHGANTYTYRTKNYMLSSVLDQRPGKIGAQNLFWKATLGHDAYIFTTFPGKVPGGSPGRWTGSASNPRVAQHKNVLVALYNAPLQLAIGELYRAGYSHAWLPRESFDEVEQEGGWTFARKGDSYAALYSARPTFYNRLGEYADSELIAPGLENAWICELGSAEENGSFKSFREEILKAPLKVKGLQVEYDSPSRGMIEFGWQGPFRVRGRTVPLRREFRYHNPYLEVPRFSLKWSIQCREHELVLDYDKHTVKKMVKSK